MRIEVICNAPRCCVTTMVEAATSGGAKRRAIALAPGWTGHPWDPLCPKCSARKVRIATYRQQWKQREQERFERLYGPRP